MANCLHGLPAFMCAICTRTLRGEADSPKIGNRRPDKIAPVFVSHGSDEMREAAAGGVRLKTPLSTSGIVVERSQEAGAPRPKVLRAHMGDSPFKAGVDVAANRLSKARVTRLMGMGITSEMSGFEPRSNWALEIALRSLAEIKIKGR